MKKLKAFWWFTRPHTVFGTITSVIALYIIAYVHTAPAEWKPLTLLITLLSCLGANIYIVGLNQLTDLEIDRINKPDLPLPAGEFTRREARAIILTALVFSLLTALTQGVFLTITVVISLLIGTAYSLPPLRLKRFHFWAAASIFTVRGVVVNIFLFLHFQYFFSGAVEIPPHIWLLTGFIFGLSLVIAWFKDIPDMTGDRQFQIITLTLRLGAGTVFRLGLGVLTLLVFSLLILAFTDLTGLNTSLLAVCNLVILSFLLIKSRHIQPASRAAMSHYYLLLWGVFYLEYLVFASAAIFC